MSASQPLHLVADHGELTSANATTVASGAKIVKTGLLYVACSSEKKSGHISVCNTIAQTGVGSFHIEKGNDFLYRYGHPANANVTGASKADPCVLTLDRQDTKIRVGEYVTMTGSAVSGYNSTIAHAEVTAVSSPQQSNGYAMTITVDADTSSLGDFTGTAVVSKSVIFRMAAETSDGSTMHLHEVQLG
jgi:hypothetical protein